MKQYELDAPNMPVRLGSALRVPSYAYSNWGIPSGAFRKESDAAYESEWKAGSPQQMQYVVEATKRSGIGDFANMLRDANARVVSRILRDRKRGKRINYLETGAGVSTLVVYKQLEQDGFDLERLYATLVEPSVQRVEATVQELEKKGLKRNTNFKTLVMGDTGLAEYLAPKSQHIISSVATIHHHAYLDRPLRILSYLAKQNGIIVLADWHNSMWEHPNRVFTYFRNEFEWPTKDQDLENFKQIYPMAAEVVPKLSGPDEEANLMIRRFWKGWAQVRGEAVREGAFNPNDDIWMLEAHRPVDRYLTELRNAGFDTNTDHIEGIMDLNPWPVLPTSSLLQVTVGQKVRDVPLLRI